MMLRNSVVRARALVRHYTSSVRIVGIGWIVFGGFLLVFALRACCPPS